MIRLCSHGGPAAASDDSAAPLADVTLPQYDRSRLSPGVVHIGVGAFHRAHQAVYFDRLAAAGCTEWGVVGVGVHSRDVADALAAQDNLFTVVTRQGRTASARVVGSLLDVLVLADDRAGVRARLADPATRLVTLTVTGAGYGSDDATVASGDSVFATIAAALDDRRRAGHPPFTVLSCDNLTDSGAAARSATLAHAATLGEDAHDWIDRHVTFPSSMVDSITPATTDESRDWVEEHFGVDDAVPVVTERFAQWVVEDSFCNGRPPLDEVGVRFTSDVGPHKLVKARMLNGTHSALGYVGALAGFGRTDEAVSDPLVHAFVDALMATEIAPLLPHDVPDMNLDEYRSSLLDRLANSAIADPLSRLCRRGTTKMADYLLPSLADARRRGMPHDLLLVSTAAWLRYLRGTDLAGNRLEIDDPEEELIAAAAALPLAEGVRLLVDRLPAFRDLRREPEFVDTLVELVEALDARGLDVVDHLLHPRLAS
jgi:mannitol-1-phosphate/altronate dehydrogenase